MREQPAADGAPEGVGVEALRTALVEGFPQLLVRVGDALAGSWPDYAEYIEEHLDQLSSAADLVVPRLLSGMPASAAGAPSGERLVPIGGDGADVVDRDPMIANLFEQVGRMHFLRGQDLTSLLTAYQSGAQVAWDHIARAAMSAGLGTQHVSDLAETLFLLVHDISVCTSRGFVSEQSDSAMATQRARAELTGALMSTVADSFSIQQAAERASWAVPESAAFVIVGLESDDHVGHGMRSDPEWLFVRVEGVVGLIVPWVAGVRARLARVLEGQGVVVGPPVPVVRLRGSFSVARSVLRLKRAGLIEGDVTFADDHLDVLLIHRQPQVLEALRRRVLAPMDDLPEATRDRLLDTLTAWLLHLGSRAAVADELHIHPQTVRYRLDQLREVFGDALDSPRERAKLFLVLAWGAPREFEEDG
ncbi:PucR family transcriptional regulator [Leekyejoonella antrihumi]|uniref:PucR family transcriptional regulator n=1 Tax=Leekyejoonella antrihumi TaxID=1660198 RepID=A0A563E5H1_9MICO|nr:helix-turn-helix domain-containing protein [Leekyejoonella antrihumi]TWP37675.1 PucR family transcriptional regulator [Leekyejoonella antrihumi]